MIVDVDGVARFGVVTITGEFKERPTTFGGEVDATVFEGSLDGDDASLQILGSFRREETVFEKVRCDRRGLGRRVVDPRGRFNFKACEEATGQLDVCIDVFTEGVSVTGFI